MEQDEKCVSTHQLVLLDQEPFGDGRAEEAVVHFDCVPGQQDVEERVQAFHVIWQDSKGRLSVNLKSSGSFLPA